MSIRRSPLKTRDLRLGAPGATLATAAVTAIAIALTACGGGDPEAPQPKGPLPYDTLSTYGFFSGALADEVPAEGVHFYDVSAPLWSDGALKRRFLVLPKDGKIEWSEQDDWGFPVGTTLIKSFAFLADLREPDGPARLIETRLLIHEDEGWTGHTYIWNDEQTEATRYVAGKRVNVDSIDLVGVPQAQEYIIPNSNQCKSCHTRDDKMHQLGLTTPMINREVVEGGASKNQLDSLNEKGLFASPPPSAAEALSFPDPFGSGPVEARARGYLSSNCAHCHRPGGGGGDSGLVLLPWETTPASFGVCKSPAAAGSGTGDFKYDIVPGFPEKSIMIFRMNSVDPELKMPELPNRISDTEGVALITAWIAAMPKDDCL